MSQSAGSLVPAAGDGIPLRPVSAEHHVDHLGRLPNELRLDVLRHLDYQSLDAMRTTCTAYYRLVTPGLMRELLGPEVMDRVLVLCCRHCRRHDPASRVLVWPTNVDLRLRLPYEGQCEPCLFERRMLFPCTAWYGYARMASFYKPLLPCSWCSHLHGKSDEAEAVCKKRFQRMLHVNIWAHTARCAAVVAASLMGLLNFPATPTALLSDWLSLALMLFKLVVMKYHFSAESTVSPVPAFIFVHFVLVAAAFIAVDIGNRALSAEEGNLRNVRATIAVWYWHLAMRFTAILGFAIIYSGYDFRRAHGRKVPRWRSHIVQPLASVLACSVWAEALHREPMGYGDYRPSAKLFVLDFVRYWRDLVLHHARKLTWIKQALVWLFALCKRKIASLLTRRSIGTSSFH
ncbi:hypothetical protein S40293_11153 [Stachybotrys chartarum IBT 40293]|nr:hypothetical protein S40293_11153 [Stachybotrys chartarum IBT 40293]